jgi:C4-dicarboxylate transporter, DctQ subunit
LGIDRKTIEWLRRRAEDIGVVMMAVMFIAFLVQIGFRYILNFPIGWTSELTIIMWLWLVLWGASFMVREREEIRFDLIYSNVGRKIRNVMAIVGAIALIAVYAFSFPAVADYVLFMKVQSTAYMKIRFDWLFSIYLIFVVAIIIRYVWILWDLFRGKEAEEFNPTDAGSGV